MPIDYKKEEKENLEEDKISNNKLKKIFSTCIKVHLDETLNLPFEDTKIMNIFSPEHNKKFDYD